MDHDIETPSSTRSEPKVFEDSGSKLGKKRKAPATVNSEAPLEGDETLSFCATQPRQKKARLIAQHAQAEAERTERIQDLSARKLLKAECPKYGVHIVGIPRRQDSFSNSAGYCNLESAAQFEPLLQALGLVVDKFFEMTDGLTPQIRVEDILSDEESDPQRYPTTGGDRRLMVLSQLRWANKLFNTAKALYEDKTKPFPNMFTGTGEGLPDYKFFVGSLDWSGEDIHRAVVLLYGLSRTCRREEIAIPHMKRFDTRTAKLPIYYLEGVTAFPAVCKEQNVAAVTNSQELPLRGPISIAADNRPRTEPSYVEELELVRLQAELAGVKKAQETEREASDRIVRESSDRIKALEAELKEAKAKPKALEAESKEVKVRSKALEANLKEADGVSQRKVEASRKEVEAKAEARAEAKVKEAEAKAEAKVKAAEVSQKETEAKVRAAEALRKEAKAAHKEARVQAEAQLAFIIEANSVLLRFSGIRTDGGGDMGEAFDRMRTAIAGMPAETLVKLRVVGVKVETEDVLDV